MSTDRRRGRRLLAFVVLTLTAAFVAACGSTTAKQAGDADPATIAPAGTPLYGDAVVQPTGDQATGLATAIRRVARISDPGTKLVEAIDHGSEPDSYEGDIAPWLGKRVGMFVVPTSGKTLANPDFAIVADVSDVDAARKEITRMVHKGELRKGSTYRDIDYDVSPRGEDGLGVAAIVDDFFVAASSVPALESVVDASKDRSLADDSSYQSATKGLDPDRVASAYISPRGVTSMLPPSATADPQVAALLDRPEFRTAEPLTAALTATADQIDLDVSGSTATFQAAGAGSGGAGDVSVGALPGDAWLGFMTANIGDSIRSTLAQSGASTAQGLAAIRQETGIDVDRDLLSWMGSMAGYVRGTTPVTLGGGLEIASSNPSASRSAVDRARAFVDLAHVGVTRPVSLAGGTGFSVRTSSLPQPVVVLAKGDKVVIGFGPTSAHDLLQPGQTLSQSDAGKAALATLGSGYTPAFVLDPRPIVTLVRVFGGNDPQTAQVLPYLSAYRSIAAGSKTTGGRTTERFVAALQDPPR